MTAPRKKKKEALGKENNAFICNRGNEERCCVKAINNKEVFFCLLYV